jgi:glutaredoxin
MMSTMLVPQRARRLALVLAAVLGLASHSIAAQQPIPPSPPALPAGGVDVDVFTQAGCPHCARALTYLADLQQRRPGLLVQYWDIGSIEARTRLLSLAREHGVDALGVPAFYVRGRLIVGFVDARTTGREIERLLAGDTAPPLDTTAARPAADVIDAPIFGPISAHKLGLPLFTVAVGLVDGLNPCARWALLLVLSVLVNLESRAKMIVVGGTFVLVAGIMYFTFMAAWLELFLWIGLSRAIQLLLGTAAVAAGAVNLKDVAVLGRGPSLGIPARARPAIYERLRRVLRAEHLLTAALAAAALSVMVNLVELICTAGLPALYTQVLSSRGLPRWQYYGYLSLYNAAYVADDAMMLGIAVITLSRRKLQERGGRWLKLVSGLVMLVLGLLLVFRPGWLM